MTERLYYDSATLQCTARVIACRATDAGFDVLTDRTVIFPESGGQLSDKGTLGGRNILHCREDGDDIWHLLDGPVEVGSSVEIVLDPEVRFDQSQQHTGEHIISGLASSMFGAKNVGFHMAEEYTTVDFDTFLDQEALDALERASNEAVQRNVPTEYRMVTPDELTGLTLRKQAKGLEGEIRIVYCGGVDSCTCCGTHCATSGEVGTIKFTAHMRYKAGTRLWLACGMRAVRSMQADARIVDELARRFSVKADGVVDAVTKQGGENASLRHALKQRSDALFGYRSKELIEAAREIRGVKLVVSLEEGLAMAELKMLSEKIAASGEAVAVLFSCDDEKLVYQLTRSGASGPDMREVCSALNAMTGGKGGGRQDYAQGSARLTPGFRDIPRQFEDYLRRVMEG